MRVLRAKTLADGFEAPSSGASGGAVEVGSAGFGDLGEGR